MLVKLKSGRVANLPEKLAEKLARKGLCAVDDGSTTPKAKTPKAKEPKAPKTKQKRTPKPKKQQ